MAPLPDILRALWHEYLPQRRMLTRTDAGLVELAAYMGEPEVSCSRSDMLAEAAKLASAVKTAETTYWVSVALLKLHYGMSERDICARLTAETGVTVNRTTLRSKLADPTVMSAAKNIMRVSGNAETRYGKPFLK